MYMALEHVEIGYCRISQNLELLDELPYGRSSSNSKIPVVEVVHHS